MIKSSKIAVPVLLCALLLGSGPTVAIDDRAIIEHRQKLAAYTLAQQQYNAEAAAYWSAIVAKRRLRNAKRRAKAPILVSDYVLIQPPRYTGPPWPIDPSAPIGKSPSPPKKYVPVIADFLASAKQYFDFVPTRPSSEIEFKRVYARIAAAGGLTRDQVVRLYAFESGGNGKYHVQAGLEYSKTGRAISTALGYNQLLHINSLGLMAEKGDRFIAALSAKASLLSGKPKADLERKIAIVRRMVAFSRTVPDRWNEHKKLANTPKGLGIHAMNLDIDVGPLLQTQKLVDSVAFARRKGYTAPMSAAELEMMNLTGDGNGFDIVTMPQALRDVVPTANFFQQGGYARNPVARRNEVVAKLLAATNATMDQEVRRQGAKDMAAQFDP